MSPTEFSMMDAALIGEKDPDSHASGRSCMECIDTHGYGHKRTANGKSSVAT
jgi:hypothetical protein